MNTCIIILHFLLSIRIIFSCDIYATIIRRVENEGFHRELNSLIEIVTSLSLKKNKCHIILEETMSSSFYVNPDELADLRRSKQITACSPSIIDIEKSQKESKEHQVLIYSQLNQTENLLSAQLIIPFHIRYHKPSNEGSYTQAQIEKPNLYMRCNLQLECLQNDQVLLPCNNCSQSNICSWKKIPFKTNAATLTLPVPIGSLSHWTYISIITWLVTFGGTVYVMAGLVRWTRRFPQKTLKKK